ncbi:NAD(P)/FAD-dependent oxidoreductase [Methanobrevibacter sp. AbM4]|uniref:NAD(P)/FAD-dependent oxidoreductase n=1 Tax=Methanobrevibacter sp. AbM4 TaxID=224719 RepID=UPI00064E435D|nr:FAD-dependent oxidoreductase [Methanobrevibacter sp. AbM4]
MEEYDLIIIGGGPAGLSAGIYSGRQNLKTLIIDKDLIGGQAREIPLIENFPGCPDESGLEIIERAEKQAKQYVEIHDMEGVNSVGKDDNNNFIVKTSKGEYLSKALILTTGSKHKQLNVKGENEHIGRGVSYCATCDGMFFKGKDIAIVGGGNTAVTNALYLNDLGCNVTLIHRRDALRCEKILEDKLKEEDINIIWNTTVEEILGDPLVSHIKLLNKDGTESEIDVNGIFISIGDIALNELALSLDVDVDSEGNIITDKEQRTNIDRVYAAGDVTGGVRQWIVASGEGAVAALSAYKDLLNADLI